MITKTKMICENLGRTETGELTLAGVPLSGLAQKYDLSDEELEAIMLREFGPIKRRRYSEPRVNSAEQNSKRPHKKAPVKNNRMIIVDGYNVIYA